MGSRREAELPCPFPMESGHFALPGCQCIHQQGSSTEPHVQSFYWGFQYIDTIHEVMGHMIELNLQSLPLHQGWAWYFWWPAPVLGWTRGPWWVTLLAEQTHSFHWRNSKGFWSPVPGLRDKTTYILTTPQHIHNWQDIALRMSALTCLVSGTCCFVYIIARFVTFPLALLSSA